MSGDESIVHSTDRINSSSLPLSLESLDDQSYQDGVSFAPSSSILGTIDSPLINRESQPLLGRMDLEGSLNNFPGNLMAWLCNIQLTQYTVHEAILRLLGCHWMAAHLKEFHCVLCSNDQIKLYRISQLCPTPTLFISEIDQYKLLSYLCNRFLFPVVFSSKQPAQA